MDKDDVNRLAAELRMIEDACKGLIRRNAKMKEDTVLEAYKMELIAVKLPCEKHFGYRIEISFADEDHASTMGLIEALGAVKEGETPICFPLHKPKEGTC